MLQYDDRRKERITVLNYDGKNADDMLYAIKNASYIIATRFHSMIMGLSCKVPLIPVVYNQKMMNVLEDLNCRDYGIIPSNLDGFDFQNANYLISPNVKELREKSFEHFRELDKILDNRI
jgi:colanic acid/amylovoran biosynthesis protein